MRLIVEVAWDSLCKHGEELCGDWVKVTRSDAGALSVVMSDGLGSGVKANILATLTVEIASSMLAQGIGVEEVLQALADTLPECQVRHLAYATFAVLQVIDGRDAFLVEYDSEPLILVRDAEVVVQLPMHARQVGGRDVREGRFALQEGDYMVMVSDGHVHAGVGGLYRLGWGWQNIATAVRRWAGTKGDAYQLVRSLQCTCLKLYGGRPGDDSTAIGMWVRQPRSVTVFTGPPAKRGRDRQVVESFMAAGGSKVVCGGTTAQIVARELYLDELMDVLVKRRRQVTVEHV